MVTTRSGSPEIKRIMKGVLTAESHAEPEQESKVARDWPPREGLMMLFGMNER